MDNNEIFVMISVKYELTSYSRIIQSEKSPIREYAIVNQLIKNEIKFKVS